MLGRVKGESFPVGHPLVAQATRIWFCPVWRLKICVAWMTRRGCAAFSLSPLPRSA